jgi:hypothetical protein
MTLLQNLPDWIYMLIGAIVFVVPAFIYLVAKGSAGKPESFGGNEFQDHSTDIYSMNAGTIGLEGSAWHD